jgi:hypothetical protein
MIFIDYVCPSKLSGLVRGKERDGAPENGGKEYQHGAKAKCPAIQHASHTINTKAPKIYTHTIPPFNLVEDNDGIVSITQPLETPMTPPHYRSTTSAHCS